MTTLIEVFLRAGIVLPKKLPPLIKRLLHIDLKTIPDFNVDDRESLFQLLYYASLFIMGYAEVDATLMEYSYLRLNPEPLEDLATSAHADIARLNIAGASFPSSYPQFRNKARYPEQLLAIYCFENCPVLRKMFARLLPTPAHKKSLLTIANFFFLGEFFVINGTQSVKINDTNMQILALLDHIDRQIANAKSQEEVKSLRLEFNKLKTSLDIRLQFLAQIGHMEEHFSVVKVYNLPFLAKILINANINISPTILNRFVQAIPNKQVLQNLMIDIQKNHKLDAPFLIKILPQINKQLITLEEQFHKLEAELKAKLGTGLTITLEEKTQRERLLLQISFLRIQRDAAGMLAPLSPKPQEFSLLSSLKKTLSTDTPKIQAIPEPTSKIALKPAPNTDKKEVEEEKASLQCSLF